MILAAGRGERMGMLTANEPKPLLIVGGVPLIERQLARLATDGFADVVINLSYRGAQIRSWRRRRPPFRRRDHVQRGGRAAARNRGRHRARAAMARIGPVPARELRRLHGPRSGLVRGASRRAKHAAARTEPRAQRARRLRPRRGWQRHDAGASAHVRRRRGARHEAVRRPSARATTAEARARCGDRARRASWSVLRRRLDRRRHAGALRGGAGLPPSRAAASSDSIGGRVRRRRSTAARRGRSREARS